MDETDFANIVRAMDKGAQLVRAQRLVGGVSADVYRLDLEDSTAGRQSVVLRVHGSTHGGHSAELEFELLDALQTLELPVPRPLLVDDSRQIVADPYLVIAFLGGSTGVPEDLGEGCVDAMAKMLATIHKPVPTEFPDLPKRTNPLPEIFDFLPQGEEWEEIEDYLRTLEDTEYRGHNYLLHGDYWPENIMWRGREIVGVLDWEDAALGDPLSDLASARVELRYIFGKDVMDKFSDVYNKSRSEKDAVDQPRLALWQIYVSSAADRYMGDWRLPAAREERMRREARASIKEAGAFLLGHSNSL